jgi:hypothetical protein
MHDIFRKLIPNKLESPASADLTTESPWYSYNALRNSKKDIRLLRRSQSLSGSVEYELVHVRLTKAKKMRYYALSYTWGDDTPPAHSVRFTNGKLFPVKDNLHTILNHSSLFRGKSYLWIDAICINQKDNVEKGLQVAQMRNIYSFAEEVIAWVGEQDQDSELTMDGLKKLVQYFPNVDAVFENKTHPDCAAAYRHITKSFREMDPMLHPHWDLSCIGRFICRPWFERIWIVQEVVMGQKVQLWCGQQSIDWNDFVYVILSLQRYNLPKLLMDTTTRLPSAGFHTCTSLATWRKSRVAGDSAFRSLGNLLLASGNFKSKYPRDKVYALLGISSSSNKGVFPDYDCTEQQAFTNSTRSMLLQSKGLLVLSAAGVGFPRKIPHLPSWVPDWTSTAGRNFVNACAYSGYHATDDRPPQIRAMKDPSLLAIDGIYIDRITAVHMLPPIHGLRRHDIEGMKRANIVEKEFASSSTKFVLDTFPSLPAEKREEVLWRTLCGNIDSSSEPLSKEYGKYFRSRNTLNDLPAEIPDDWTKAKDDHTRSLAVEAGMYIGAWNYLGVIRRLCRTARGFLGLVAPETKVGDSVCLLLGGDAPFVVRQNEPTPDSKLTYTLVGDCYVHGLMNEEGMKMGEIQEFILR